LLGGSTAAASQAPAASLRHLAWVWQFNQDGTPEEIRSALARNGLGITLKTHDGKTWMGKWDDSHLAIYGPSQVRAAASFFESGGVPFHAWCCVKGKEPEREAEMCAEVLASGARSMMFDLEPPEDGHYWQGTSESALTFGREMRRLAPDAWLTVAPDPRPWQLKSVPIGEFASFCNEINPQTYWDTFNTSANYRLLREFGHPPGPDGVTPESILDVTRSVLGQYGLPIRPIGQGKSDRGSWARFVDHGLRLGMDAVSIWRYGTCNADIMSLLSEKKPTEKEKPPEPAPMRGRALTSGLFGSKLTGPPSTKRNSDKPADQSATPASGVQLTSGTSSTNNKLRPEPKSLFHWTKKDSN
jgi:hypothetical protein